MLEIVGNLTESNVRSVLYSDSCTINAPIRHPHYSTTMDIYLTTDL